MKILVSDSTYAPFNLATEEFLLKHTSDSFLFLYIDEPCIVIGKHQNTYNEINFAYTNNHNIPIFRRLSGGGTVYHDEGNINFCFITSGEEKSKLVDFTHYTQQILDALKDQNINAEMGGRHDLLINNKKISGNASHVFKNRVMHHGTLLFNSNLANLSETLKTDPNKYQGHSVKSVRSMVTTISANTTSELSISIFMNSLMRFFIKKYPSTYVLSDQDYEFIKNLSVTKYETWEWNYGYSPNYEFKKRITLINTLTLVINLHVSKGAITEAIISANKWNEEIQTISKSVKGLNHDLNTVRNHILNPLYLLGLSPTQNEEYLFF